MKAPIMVMPPVLLVTLLTTASCDDDTDAGSTNALANWSLSDEPSVVIGGADEREGYLLHGVVGATRLGDGRVVVAHEGTLQLRYYDLEGVHLYDAGGQGEGPGEFESLVGFVRLPGDSVPELPGTEESYGDDMYACPKTVVFAVREDLIHLGQTGSDTILAMSVKGDTVATLVVPFEPVTVPADAGMSGSARWHWIYPDHYPRYARLVAAPEDRFWVMAYPTLKQPIRYSELMSATTFRRLEDGARWRVVDRDGLPIAEVRTPAGFFLVEVGDDHVLGVHKDQFDRESVQLYRLVR